MLATIRDALLHAAAKMNRRPATGDSRRILVLQPDHLGDIILSEPAVRLLRHYLPDHEFIAVVGPWSEEIANLAWAVDRVITVEYPGFERGSRGGGRIDPYARLGREARRLADLNAAHAVVLRDDAWWTAWLAMLSTSGMVITADHPRTSTFASIAVPMTGIMHRSEQSLRIASSLLGRVVAAQDANGRLSEDNWDMSPSIAPPHDALVLARAARDEHRIPSPYIVIHPGAGAEVKCWPERYWRALFDDLAPHAIAITGSAAERGLCERLADGFPHVTSLAGESSLEALAGLLLEASAVIGTDNGPLHLAAAVGTPTVRIFGPSSAERYGPPPGASDHIVLDAGWTCSRCEDLSPSRPAGCGCMVAVTPAMVLTATEKFLNHVA